MHIILGILGAIAAASYYFFILRKGADAAGQAIDMAQTVRGKMRRNAFRKKADGSVLTAVEDAGTAAAIIMMKTAECKGVITDETRDLIKAIIKDEIGMEDSDEVVPFAEWVSNQVASPNDIIRQYKSLWMNNLNSTQMSEFIDMVQRIASLDGEPNNEQKEIIRQMRTRLLS